jgi:hypothetical protein
MLNSIAPAIALVLVVSTQTAVPTANNVVDAYIRALGGEDALRRVTGRVTEGQFDNGRGLRETFRLLEKTPNTDLPGVGW